MARPIAGFKEDLQVFRTLVKRAISKEEAFQCPLTSFPLSLAESDGSLWQEKNKASLYKQIIKDCPSSKSEKVLGNAQWIYDGKALVHRV